MPAQDTTAHRDHFRLGTSLLGLALLASTSSCIATRTQGTSDARQGDGAAEAQPAEVTAAVTAAAASRGLPHVAPIANVALSPDGEAALSQDTQDGIRLWAALDGSVEPVSVPVGSVRTMALVKQGEGVRVAFVDAASQLVVGLVDSAGVWTQTGARAPTAGIIDAQFTKDGVLVVLTDDHRVEVVDAEAKTLGTLSPRGRRLSAILPVIDGSLVAVLDAKSPATSPGMTFRGEVQRLTLRDRAPILEGPVRTIELPVRPHGSNLTVSPNGAIAWVQRDLVSSRWFVRTLDAQGRTSDVDLGFHASVSPVVAFVAPDRLHVVSREASKACELTLGAISPQPRASPRNMGQTGAFAFAAGKRVASDGNWLGVMDLRTGTSKYLGYDNFAPTSGAAAGAGGGRAWLVWPDVLLEDANGRVLARHSFQSVATPVGVAYLDATRLLVVGSEGMVAIVDAASGRVLESNGSSAGISEMSWSPSAGILLIRTFSSEIAVFRIRSQPSLSIEGPWLLSEGAFRMGVRPGTHGDDVPVVWTSDGAVLREFSIDMLRRDLTRDEQLAAKREIPAAGDVNVFAVGAKGELYEVVLVGSSSQLVLLDPTGVERARAPLGTRSVQSVQVAPDGATVIATVTDDGGRASLLGLDARTLKSRWSSAMGGFVQTYTFSLDGKRLISPITGGGIELDVADGRVVHRRCGLDFNVRSSPPATAIFFADSPGACTK